LTSFGERSWNLDRRTCKLYVWDEGKCCHACGNHVTALREKLAGFLNQVTDDNEVVIVRRRGGRDVAIIPADELSSLMETAHLLSSPKNAERLLQSLAESIKNDGANLPDQSPAASLAELRRSEGI
jgi:antitoxin YefM